MSQFPTNPAPPGGWPGGSVPYATYGDVDPLAPARRAGALMSALGLVCLMCGGLFAWTAANFQLVMSKYPPDVLASLPPEFNAHAVRVLALVLVGVAVVMMVVGFIVRRGSKTAAVIGIIVTSVILLWC